MGPGRFALAKLLLVGGFRSGKWRQKHGNCFHSSVAQESQYEEGLGLHGSVSVHIGVVGVGQNLVLCMEHENV